MKFRYAKYIYIAFVAVLAIVIASCSTKNNTSQTRWWHAFHAKYNTYYNGAQAYIDASLEKENGNKDNFTELIPLYTVGNKTSRELGKSNFERAIEKAEKAIARHSIKKKPEWNKSRRKTEKDIEWLSRREYNPFLWKAWMLMGRSQFHKGAFEEAATTFAYMSRLYRTQPAIYGKARAWLAKSYIEAGWLYDAEDVIRNMQRDSIDWRAVREWDYTFADYYIHTGELEKAVPYLRRVIKQEMRRKQKAREWYLMGQIQAALGNKDAAYNAFQHVIRSNPPYELEFNARVAATEVMAAGQAKQMVSRLKRMVASDKNKEYLDQVYYAMGNIYLTNKDTTNAIAAYEQGNKKSTRSGIEKGVLLLRLGDLYWAKEKFSDARRCYNEALGLLDKDRKDYEQLSERAKVLDELTPHTEAVHLQDSLQYLAKCPETERFAGADDTYCIEALMQDGKALQAGTSHFLGQNFAKAFEVKYATKEGALEYVWASSWGVFTRLMGALIMSHSDDNGLVLPPLLAPIQVVIVPIYKGEEQLQAIRQKVTPLMQALKERNITVKFDDDDTQKPGFKFHEYELKGVPVRLAVGQRDLENNTYEVARRDTLTKESVSGETIVSHIEKLLKDIQENIYQRALAYRDSHITEVNSYEQFKEVLESKGGFLSAHWDGTPETEAKIKEETQATIRCIPLDQKEEAGTCIYSGKPSKGRVLFAKAY